MSLKTDAETIIDAAHEIVRLEILRTQLQNNGGVIFAVPDDPYTGVTLTAAQKGALLAQEQTLQTQIKTISAAW